MQEPELMFTGGSATQQNRMSIKIGVSRRSVCAELLQLNRRTPRLRSYEVGIELSVVDGSDLIVNLLEEFSRLALELKFVESREDLSFEIVFPSKISAHKAAEYMFDLMNDAGRTIDTVQKINRQISRQRKTAHVSSGQSAPQAKTPDVVQPSLF